VRLLIFRVIFYRFLNSGVQNRGVSNQQSQWLTPARDPVIARPGRCLAPETGFVDGEACGIAPAAAFVCPEMTVTATPSPDDFQEIFRLLDEFNTPVVGRAIFVPLAVLLRDDAGKAIGGLWGWTVYSWLIINMLFVPEALRHRGIGSALIRAAEAEARSRGCAGMQVDTFGFQAQPFYERMGFTVFGVQPNFPPGQRCVFLRKPFE
jgi:GNAT superfamily N-acetyltransferase